jgi:uncharacterized protein
MQIAVVGGTGMVGSRVVAEAARRGHQVTSVSRSGAPAEASEVTPLAADVTHATIAAELAARHDAVVLAIGPTRDPAGNPADFPVVLIDLVHAMKPTRLLLIGGAGSLQAAPGVRLVDTPDFPAEYKAEALAHAAALDALRALGDAGEWTYLSPAPEIAPGRRTGVYLVSDETPAGARISAEDFAVAVVDELEVPRHERRRFTVAN